MRRLAILLTVTLIFGLTARPADAAPAWYHGELARIFLGPGTVIMTFKSSELNDCQHGYVYFFDSVVGETTVNRAYSMALTAMQSGKSVGVVIDKAINGPGGRCDAIGSIDIRD